MLPDHYPKTHTIARQLLAMDNVIAALPMPIFDSPGEMQALPVVVSPSMIGDRPCVIFKPVIGEVETKEEIPAPSMEWETIPDIQVRHIWKLTEGDKCDIPENQRTVAMSPDQYEESGTPICPECGSDLEYSHTEVLKSPRLVVTQRSGDFHVCPEGDPKTWECGETQFEAVGKWFLTHKPGAVKWYSPSPIFGHGSRE